MGYIFGKLEKSTKLLRTIKTNHVGNTQNEILPNEAENTRFDQNVTSMDVRMKTKHSDSVYVLICYPFI